MYIIQTVQTPSPWRPQLPLPKEVTSINDRMEHKNKKDSSAPASKSKWSFGGFFRKKKKDLDSDSTTDDDFKAGFKSPPSSGQQKRNKNSSKTRKSRPSKLLSGFDHIVVSPTSSLDKYRETDSLNSTDRVPSIDCSRSNTGSLDRRNRRERAKSRIESRGNSSSDEDSHNSLNSNSLSRFKSDESIGNLSGSLNRKTRTARNDRYLKRLSKEENGMSPTTTLSVKGSSNSVDTSYSNQKPNKLQNSSSLTQVNQLLNGGLKPFIPSSQSFQSSAQSLVNNPHILLKSPPIPPPRDPQRRLTVNNPLVLDSRPISYAFDKSSSSHSPQPWNLNNRCVSDDKLWGTSNLINPLVQRPASVQSSIQPQRRYISRHETESLSNRNLLPSNQSNGYTYVADVAPRSRKPIHIVEDKTRDLQPPLILTNSHSPKLSREKTSPVSSASNFWRKIDQEEIERRSRPNEIVKPRLIKPRSASSSRISTSGLSYPVIQPKDSLFSSPTNSTSSSSFRQFGALESKIGNPARHEKRNSTTVVAAQQPADSKSNSMPTYYKKLSSPPLINRYEEYIVKRNKTQPVSEFDLKSVLTLYPLKKPPEPPQRNLSKRNSAIESDIITALPVKPATQNKNRNLDDAINELEAIYNSLKLYDDSIFDRPVKRDIPPNSNPATSFNDFVKNNKNIKEFEDDDDDTPVGEPDVVRDDVVVRNIKHANSILKTVEPQPPFGIPIGPIPPKPVSDYLTVKVPEKPKLSFVVPRRSPDLVADDLAFRQLRKDSGPNVSANTKLDHFILPNKKKRAMRSMSANIYNLIHRDAAKPSGGTIDDYFNLEKALEKAESLTDLNNADNDHPSTLWLLKKNRREERDRKTGAVFNLPSTLNSSPAGQPFISHVSAKEHHDVLDALVREAQETSEKLGQDLIELRNDKQSTTKNHILKEIDEVSKAAKLCEDILKEVTNNVLSQVDEKPVGVVTQVTEKYEEKLDDEIDPIVKLDKKITELENQKAKLINQNLLVDIDEVADSMKNCEKYLIDELVSPDSSSTVIEHSPSPYEKSRLKEMIEQKSNKINNLITNLEPETEAILKITERCQNELNKMNKDSDDEPNYDNLNACETDTIDLIIFNSTPDIVENDDEIELSVSKQLTLVDDIDKIIQEAAEVIKENNTTTNNNDNVGIKLLSDDDNGKSSSTTPNRVNSSSITSFNPMSSSDYLKSPSSEYRPPSDINIKSSSTTSYDVKSSSVTPNHINNSFSDSNDDYDNNNNNNNNDSNNNNSNSFNNNNDSSQYNSSEELAMIFGMTPQTPTDSLSEFSKTANYSCHTSKEQNKSSDLPKLTNNKLTNDSNNNNNNKDNFQLLVSTLENVSNSDLNASPFLQKPQFQNQLEYPYKSIYIKSAEDLIKLYDSSGEDLYSNSEDEAKSSNISQSGHRKLFDIICQESDLLKTNMNSKTNHASMDPANKRKRVPTSSVPSTGRDILKPAEQRATTRTKSNRDAITDHKSNNIINSKLEKENNKEKTNNEKTDSSSGTGKRYILRSSKTVSTNNNSQPNSLLGQSTKPSSLRSSSANPSSRSKISSSSGTLSKLLISSTTNSNEPKPIKSSLVRPKSTPAIIHQVGASQKMTSSTESSSNSFKLPNTIRTTRASRLRASAFDNQRTKEKLPNRSRLASQPPSFNKDNDSTVVSPTLFNENNLQDKLNKITANNTNKRLIPSIAVCVNQTLRDDDKTLVPFSSTEIENESSLTISPRKRTSTLCKNGEVLSKSDFGLSPVKSCHSNSSSPGNERDKSAKRKSNLNRALNTESTNDDAAAAKRRSRRQLGMARTLIPEDSSLMFIKTNSSGANTQSAKSKPTAGINSNNKVIDSCDLKAVTNFNNNHILNNNNNSNNNKTKDTVNINSKNNNVACCSTSSSDEKSRLKSSSDVKLNLAKSTSPTKINVGETRKQSANTNNNKIASSMRSQTISSATASTANLPNVVKKISVIRCKSDLPKIEKISLKLSSNNDGAATKNQPTSSLQLSTVPSASSSAFSLKTSSNKFEEKFNELMSECDKKLTSLTPIGDILQPSPSPRSIDSNNYIKELPEVDQVVANVVNDEPNLVLENIAKKIIPTPLKLHSKSLDDSRLESVQNHIVSILKKKDPNDSSSSSNASPVTFSSSVLDTPTRTSSRQGILKKRSSLDESRYSRSQSPDDRGILIRNQRRNSLEESQHGILKQRNSEPKIDNQNQNDFPPHGILKKKDTPTSSESTSKHVSITEAAFIAAAELSGDQVMNGNGYDVKPILKSDSSTNPTNAPRPILKKKYSSETEEIRPILKSSRKSSREENLSDTDDCIRSILKTDSPLKRMNYTSPFDANMVLQRSKSLETQEYNNQLDGIGARSGDGFVSSTVLSTLDKPVVTVSERIRNMEKLLGAVPKTTLTKRDKDRFKTQPVTLEEFNSVQKSCASIFKPITSLENLNHSQGADDEESINLYKFSQSSQALSSVGASFNYFGEMSLSNMTDSNNSENPGDLFESTTSTSNNSNNNDDDDDDDYNKEKKNTVNLVRKPSIKDRAKFLEKMANNQRDDDKMKKPLMNRSQHPPKINIRDSTNDSNDFDGEKINKSLSTSSIGNEVATSSSSNNIHNEGGGGGGGLYKPKMGCVGLFPSALNSELKNRLKKSTHASVANLKKSKSNILDSTTFSSNNDNNNTSLNKNRNNNNNEINSSHDSSSDSDNIIVPSKNLAQALRNLSSSSSSTTTTTTQSAFAGVDINNVDRINNNHNNSDDTKSLISNLQNFDKTIKEQIQQQQHHSSTSEGESSGGREISEIIKNSAIARRKKYSDGFEHWTAPEFYKAAEENVIKERTRQLKLANLEKRREKLRTLLETESEQNKNEVDELTRPRSKKYPTNMLNEIATNIHRTKTEKYRSDLEAKLYKKWRYGLSPDRENIILESKNENIAMAKLNWLDKQVELHLKKEQCLKESEERKLKLEHERRKHEEFITKSHNIREAEIKELRSIQQNHLHELKLREDDCNHFKNDEELLNCHKLELEDLLKSAELNFVKRKEQSVIYFNIRKIKMLFRKRSNDIQNDIQEDVAILNKMYQLNKCDRIMSIIKKFESQLVTERERQKMIECMYESEVKYQLIKQQTQWADEISTREIVLKNLILDELEGVTKKCDECVEQQKYLLDVRKSHLTAISDLNDRLKGLMLEENEFSKSKVYDIDENVEKITEVIKKDNNDGRLEPPRFGRKKVAWI